ncbi:hypothetical protein D3C87_111120 [compost metagenome]
MKLKCVMTAATAIALMVPGMARAEVEQLDLGAMASSEMAYPMAETLLGISAEEPQSCKDLVLDDTQKGQMKEAYFNFRKQRNTLGAEVRNAQLDVIHTVTDPASTKDQATAAVGTLKTAMGALGDANSAFHLTVFYDILKPEQRETAWKCMMDMKKMMMQEKLKRMCERMPKEPTPPTTPPARH